MSLEFPAFREPCECRRSHTCAVCRDWRQKQPHLARAQVRQGAPRRGPLADVSTLVAGHAEVARLVNAGETYPRIAEAYDVTLEVLMGYLIRTGVYVQRQAPQRAYIASLAPQIRADHAEGNTIKALVRRHGLTIHTVRRILHEKETA